MLYNFRQRNVINYHLQQSCVYKYQELRHCQNFLSLHVNQVVEIMFEVSDETLEKTVSLYSFSQLAIVEQNQSNAFLTFINFIFLAVRHFSTILFHSKAK